MNDIDTKAFVISWAIILGAVIPWLIGMACILAWIF